MSCEGCGGETMQDVMAEMGVPRQSGQPAPAWRWLRIDRDIETRLMRVLGSWVGTRYIPGQCARRAGTDCVQLVAGLLDELHGVKPRPVPRKSANAAANDVRAGFATIRAIRDRYPSNVVRGGTIQPGDVVVTRAEQHRGAAHHPGHTMMAGASPWSALDAMPSRGVQWTTLAASRAIVRVYRPMDKDQWI